MGLWIILLGLMVRLKQISIVTLTCLLRFAYNKMEKLLLQVSQDIPPIIDLSSPAIMQTEALILVLVREVNW